MNANYTSRALMAALCMIPGECTLAAACMQASLDGARTLVSNCGDGSCGIYQIGLIGPGATNLGWGGSLPDVIYFEFYSSTASPPATGTFDLGGGKNGNYATCEQCILVYQDYFGTVPQKTFFQTGGTLTIDANTVPGIAANIGLTWSNVTLAQVTLDPETFASTLVPGGDCYTISAADSIFRSGFETP